MNLRDWLEAMQRTPREPDESDSEMTDRHIREGAKRGMNRQCSIGWHEECSDPDGEDCRCPCHMASAPSYGTLANYLLAEMRDGEELRRLAGVDEDWSLTNPDKGA